MTSPSDGIVDDSKSESGKQVKAENVEETDEDKLESVLWVPPLVGSFIIACFLVDGPWVVVRSTLSLFIFSGALGTLLLGLGCVRAILFSFRFDLKLVQRDSLLAIAWLHVFLIMTVFSLWVAPLELVVAITELILKVAR